MSASAKTLAELRRARRRSRFLIATAVVAVGLVVAAWSSPALGAGDLFSARRTDAFERFMTVDLVPAEVRAAADGEKLDAFGRWLAPRLRGRNLAALLSTLLLAVSATALASAGALLLAPLAARRRAGEPQRFARAFRWLCVLLRATPEYVLAFLLGAVFQSPAWAAVLALAVHNAGVLGRLFGETLENLDPRAARAYRGLGAAASSRYVAAELPQAAPRLFTYVFYRFETCVRESTALGMLG
ncbi:MAG: ABC transporter permease subunit, partial [Planctomycetota bacterium]